MRHRIGDGGSVPFRGTEMTRLYFLVYTLAATVLAGSAVIAALTLDMIDVRSIVVAAALGALLAVPVAWGVTKSLADQG